MKFYKDLSRRALIELNTDYDKTSNNALSEFLQNQEKVYEPVRPVEALVEKVDNAQSTIVSKSKTAINKLLSNELDKVMDKVIDALDALS